MGTNYYWSKDQCKYCGRYDEQLHIGKSSVGWQFSFHALPEILSFKNWKDVFSTNGQIVDEDGFKFTPEEFLQLVESKQGEPFNHARDVGVDGSAYEKYMKEAYKGYEDRAVGSQRDYLDPEGYSFSWGDFS